MAGSGNGGLGRIIAVGLDPAPPSGVISIPVGNRAGSFTTGPAGYTPGTPNGAPTGNAGSGGPGAGAGGDGGRQVAEIRVPGLTISGGVRPPSASIGPVVSGPPPAARVPAMSLPDPVSPARRTDSPAALMARATRPQLPLPEWRRGEDRREREFLVGKKVHILYINMPNMTSRSGSWVLRFAELADQKPGDEPELTAPVALRKVDPIYDPDALRDGVQGMVELYAIIRQNGSVDSIRVVRGLDPRLDANAVQALVRWEFQPARRNGTPVDLEALVQVPFSLAPKPD